MVAWGSNFRGETDVPVEARSGVTAIAAGFSHTVAVKSDGSVVAWGNNVSGQTIVPVVAQSGVTAIAAGREHTVALKNDGSVVAWGSNVRGQTTVPIAARSGVMAIAAGGDSTAALKTDGSVVVWGSNDFGQAIVPVEAQSGVKAIALGDYHSVALKIDGSVVAWGNACCGQTNVPVTAWSGVQAIAAGSFHSVALKTNGSVVAWGGTCCDQTKVPFDAHTGVKAIAASFDHVVALKTDGSVVAWGSNAYGESTVPVAAQSGVTAIAAGSAHTVALAIPVAPIITTLPKSQTVNVGEHANFTVAATGMYLSYQWRHEEVNIAGATNATYAVASALTISAGGYTVVVSNSAGSVTSTPPSVLTVTTASPGSPVILDQPASQSVTAGQNVTLSVSASGVAPLFYQWRLNGANWIGATAASLTITNFQAVDAGRYDVVSSNAFGSVTSAQAVLSASPPETSEVVEFSTVPRGDFWTTDKEVWDLASANGRLYLCGSFTYLAKNVGAGSAVDLGSGFSDPGFPRVAGRIAAIVPDGAGGWYIGGHFETVDSLPLANLIHLRQDRSVDTSWAPNPDNAVSVLAVADGKVFAGGLFRRVNGEARNALAALDAITGRLLSWDPQPNITTNYPFSGGIDALVVSGDTVYVAGLFNRIGGQPRKQLAALATTDASATAWNPNFNGFMIWALAVNLDTVFVGGLFNQIGGLTRPNLAALDRTTGSAKPWNPAPDNAVMALAAECDDLFVSGTFSLIGGQTRKGLAAVDIGTGNATDWDPGVQGGLAFSADAAVKTLTVVGNTVYAGGSFTNIGGQNRKYLAALDITTGRATGWNPEVGAPVKALGILGSTLLSGGESEQVSRVYRNNLAAVDEATGAIAAWNPDIQSSVVSRLAYLDDRIYFRYSPLQTSFPPQLAAVNATTGTRLKWNPIVNGGVAVIKAGRGKIYIGGSFNQINGQPRSGVAALDAETGAVTPWNPLIDYVEGSTVNDILPTDDGVYLAGGFRSIGGKATKTLAAVDATEGNLIDWNPNVGSGFVLSMARSGRLLYFVGNFRTVGGQPRNNLAAVHTSTGLVTDWDPNADNLMFSVASVAAFGGRIYAGGNFKNIGGRSRNGVAALDPLTGVATEWDVKLDQEVPNCNVKVTSNGIYLTGRFESVGGVFRPGFAALPRQEVPVLTRQPRSQQTRINGNVTFEVAALGQTPLSYQWRFNGTDIAGATNTYYAVRQAQVANSGHYSVVVNSGAGVVGSAEAALTVVVPPVLISIPVSSTLPVGSFLPLSAAAIGNPPPFFQWRRNGVNIPGANGSALTILDAQSADGGSYAVVAANSGGAVTSPEAEINVVSPALPLSDQFDDRVLTNSVRGVASGSNRGATRQPEEPRHAGKLGGKSVWFAWRAPANGIATVDTRGSSFDTLLAVYVRNEFSQFNEVASDDDRGAFLTSAVAFNASAGTEYLIAVDGFGGTAGNVVLSWSLEAGVSEVPRIFQQPLSQSLSAGQSAAVSVTAFASRPLTYQWYQNCRVVAGATNASLTVVNVQLDQVGRYTVVVNAGSHQIESLPAFLEIGSAAKLITEDKLLDLFVAPQVASIARSGFTPRAVAGGSVAAGVSGAQVLNNFGASTELGEPNHAGVIGGASRWFRLQAEENGVLIIDTLGSQIDTVLAVYSGTNLLSLRPIASDNNSGADGFSSWVRFPAERGVEYLVAVDGVNGAHGIINVNWRLGIPPQVNQLALPQSVRIGDRLTLSVTASGWPTPTYQWRLNDQDLTAATNAAFNLSNIQLGHAGRYSVTVSNFAGSATHEIASVTIEPASALRLSLDGFQPDGSLRLRLADSQLLNAVIQASTNLINWSPLWTNLNTNPQILWMDQAASNYSKRFYRALR